MDAIINSVSCVVLSANGLWARVMDIVFPKENYIEFTVNPDDIVGLPAAPTNISFDEPYSWALGERAEGYFSLGVVPNADVLEDTLLASREEVSVIKEPGSEVFRVPESCEALLPAIKLAASFEAAHSSCLVEKTAQMVVRDYDYWETEPPQDFHRDPPIKEIGLIHNLYAMASNNPTEFITGDPVQSYEMICFTASAVHRRPQIEVKDNKCLRRLFVAIAFSHGEEERAILRQQSVPGVMNP